MTSTFTLVFSADIDADLSRFCRKLCIEPACFMVLNGIGVAVTVEAIDAPAVECGAAAIATWRADMRARVASTLNSGGRVPLDLAMGLQATLDGIAEAHWRETDGAGRWARSMDASARTTVKAA